MKKFTAILLAFVMLFTFAACGSKSTLTKDVILNIVKDKGGSIQYSDFEEFEATEGINKYKTYTYELEYSNILIVRTDKDTGETLEVRLLNGKEAIDLNKSSYSEVDKFFEEHK